MEKTGRCAKEEVSFSLLDKLALPSNILLVTRVNFISHAYRFEFETWVSLQILVVIS